MKKIILTTVIVFMSMTSFAQLENGEESTNQISEKSALVVTYRLFPTENMWTFIKLNTRNGKMWQVQYDVQGNNRFETYLNLIPLVEKEMELDNRFTLYSTQNSWTFILLDQIDGNTWQVQWS